MERVGVDRTRSGKAARLSYNMGHGWYTSNRANSREERCLYSDGEIECVKKANRVVGGVVYSPGPFLSDLTFLTPTILFTWINHHGRSI